jgi:hypothetical protein
MLEFCQHLARVWMGYREDGAMSQRVGKLGLKADAYRVWKLAARKMAEGPRSELAALLGRLDPGTFLQEGPTSEGGVNSLLELAEALKGTPLETPVQGLLKRLDSTLGNPNLNPRRALRRRIARIQEDWSGWAGLLGEDLAEAKSFEATCPLLDEAARFLGEHSDGTLLAAGTQRLMAAVQGMPAGNLDLAQRLEAWARLQSLAGHSAEAESLLRLRLDLEDPKGLDISARCELLARLARWQELDKLLGPAQAKEPERMLGWRFRMASGLRQGQEARQWLDAWLAQVTGPEAPAEPPLLPGLSGAIPYLSSRPEVLGALVTRYGRSLSPGQEPLLVREPWRILAALDPDAPASLLPTRAEESLRWRWSRLAEGEPRRRLLGQLLQEAEAQLGASHLLVAELLVELGEIQKEEGFDAFERAQRILESLPGNEILLAKVYLSMAAACSQLDGKGLERNILKAMELLERTPSLNAEAEDWVREMPSLLLLHLWREQRLEELAALGPRVQALGQRASRPPSNAAELGIALTALARIAQLQAQLRAAGLP